MGRGCLLKTLPSAQKGVAMESHPKPLKTKHLFQVPEFKVLPLQPLLPLLFSQAVMVTLDLRDTCLLISIYRVHKYFLRFIVERLLLSVYLLSILTGYCIHFHKVLDSSNFLLQNQGYSHYFHMSIHWVYGCISQMRGGEGFSHCQFISLLIGLDVAPTVFTECLAPVIACCRTKIIFTTSWTTVFIQVLPQKEVESAV